MSHRQSMVILGLMYCISILVSCTQKLEEYHIAFRFQETQFDEGKIFLLSDLGSEQVILPVELHNLGCPSWSPEGERLVFIGNQEEEVLFNDLYKVDTDGRKLEKLTQGEKIYYGVSWSPDGEYLVYSAGSAKPQLYLMDLMDREEVLLRQGVEFYYFPDWEPNGESIIFSSNLIEHETVELKPSLNYNYDIFRYVLDSGELTRLTDSIEMELVRNPVRDYYPRWSNVGDQIVYISERCLVNSQWVPESEVCQFSEGSSQTETESRLILYNPETGERNEVLRVIGVISFPSWSPDDSQIVFSSNMNNLEVGNDRFGLYDIFIIDLESGEITQITFTGNNTCPDWQP